MKNTLLTTTFLSLLVSIAPSAKANVLYFAQPVNFDQGEINTVFIYGASGTAGTVSSLSGYNSSFSVGSNNVTSVVIPSSYDLTQSGVITKNGFTISANGAVGASYLSREPFTTDTTYLFDSTALGTTYYAVGTIDNISGNPSQLSIVGTKNGTTVTITPSTKLASGQAAGVPFTVTLDAGQAVLYTDAATGTDITGTKIVSSAPIAVFGGSQCANVPSSATACDHTITALPSVDNYTTKAVIPTTTGTEGTSSNILRILAATDGTVVSYNGAVVATLDAGKYADIRTGLNGGVLTSTSPVLLNEYLTGQSEHGGVDGDPAQTYIPGVDQELASYVFSTPVGSQAYTDNFLNISIATADIAMLMLNGSSVPVSDCTALTSSIYSTCQISIAAGAGTISAANPFLLLINGGTQNDSYLTFAGTTFSAGASPAPTPTPDPTPNPVPEPASLALLAVGIAFTCMARRSPAIRI